MRLRALLFEDEPIVRQFLWAVLDQRGYEVFSYPEPDVCPLKSIGECPCPCDTVCADMIITDIQMPGTNGLDFIEELIKKNCKRPQIAIVSGSWTEAEMERAARLGCKSFRKPIRMAELVEWLQEVEKSIPPDRRLFGWQFS